MWPGFWVVSVVPILALVAVADAFIPLSKLLATLLHVRRAEFFLLAVLIAVFLLLDISFDLKLSDVWLLRGSLVQYESLEIAEKWFARSTFENRMLVLDFLLITVSIPVIIRMALWRQRPLLIWLPLALLGNVGAIVWLAVNGRYPGTENGKAVPLTPPTSDVHGHV